MQVTIEKHVNARRDTNIFSVLVRFTESLRVYYEQDRYRHVMAKGVGEGDEELVARLSAQIGNEVSRQVAERLRAAFLTKPTTRWSC